MISQQPGTIKRGFHSAVIIWNVIVVRNNPVRPHWHIYIMMTTSGYAILSQMLKLDSLSKLLETLFDLSLDALRLVRVSLRLRCLLVFGSHLGQSGAIYPYLLQDHNGGVALSAGGRLSATMLKGCWPATSSSPLRPIFERSTCSWSWRWERVGLCS